MDLLRSAVLRLSEMPAARRILTQTARGRSVAGRFVAGESLEDALRAALELQEEGIATMFDLLGEHVADESSALACVAEHEQAIGVLEDHPELDAALSVKPSQLGLDLSEEFCGGNLERILRAAGGRILVMMDMEHHESVDPTLRLFRELHPRFDRFGVALQAYLHRTAKDVAGLPAGCIVRLVKGAYLEPHELAFSKMADVDRAYGGLVAALIERGHTVHVATHDPRLIERARRLADRLGDRARVEFQMLYGIRRDLQRKLAREGYPVRVYVPYGAHWYPYLTRRLAERPANMWFFLRNLARSKR